MSLIRHQSQKILQYLLNNKHHINIKKKRKSKNNFLFPAIHLKQRNFQEDSQHEQQQHHFDFGAFIARRNPGESSPKIWKLSVWRQKTARPKTQSEIRLRWAIRIGLGTLSTVNPLLFQKSKEDDGTALGQYDHLEWYAAGASIPSQNRQQDRAGHSHE